MVDKLCDISDRLMIIAEEISDLALDDLRARVASGATKASDTEKRLSRARRSVEKAAYLLREPPLRE